jgi:hypothetical protein
MSLLHDLQRISGSLNLPSWLHVRFVKAGHVTLQTSPPVLWDDCHLDFRLEPVITAETLALLPDDHAVVLGTTHVAPALREELRDREVGYLDLAGNFRAVCWTRRLYVETPYIEARPKASAPPIGKWHRGRASRVVRALLSGPRPEEAGLIQWGSQRDLVHLMATLGGDVSSGATPLEEMTAELVTLLGGVEGKVGGTVEDLLAADLRLREQGFVRVEAGSGLGLAERLRHAQVEGLDRWERLVYGYYGGLARTLGRSCSKCGKPLRWMRAAGTSPEHRWVVTALRRTPNLFYDRAEARCPCTHENVTEALSSNLPPTEALVSRVLKSLESEGLVRLDRDGRNQRILLPDWARLFRHWAQRYGMADHRARRYWWPGSHELLAEQIKETGYVAAATGSLAARLRRGESLGPSLEVYVRGALDFAEEAGLQEESRGTLVLLEPNDDGVFWQRRDDDSGLSSVSDLQLALDLWHGPPRSRQVAEAIVEESL